MHTPIHQIRQDLLSRRTSFARSPQFDSAYTHFLSHFHQFLLQEAQTYQAIAFCWPYREELDLREPLREWQSSNSDRCLLLPKVRADRQLSFYTWSDSDPLVHNTYGIAEPDPTASGVQTKNPDCILIPCVGWLDYQNRYWRLGYGGGYFDRTIASLKQAGDRFTTVGIAFDWQRLDPKDWAPQAHDQALDLIISNSGMYRKLIKS